MSKILYTASSMSHINSFHRDYIAALLAEGHEVKIMARGEGADFDIPFEKKLLSKKNRACRKAIREILDRENFDLVILNTSLAAFHIRLAAGRKRARIINIAHGYLFSKKAFGIKGLIKKYMLLFAEKLLARKTDAVLTMNKEDFEMAKRHKLCRGKIINTMGMGVKSVDEKLSADVIRKELACEGDFVLLFVGELSSRKNQEYLIKRIPKLSSHIPNIKLWLVGDGDKRIELVDLAESLGVSDRVLFLGRRENPLDYMRASDLYVSAAYSEGLPFNIVEALAVGTPVLASKIKGHTDILDDGCGYTFALSSDDEFERAVKGIHGGELCVSYEKMQEGFSRFSYESVFPDTYAKIKEAGEI